MAGGGRGGGGEALHSPPLKVVHIRGEKLEAAHETTNINCFNMLITLIIKDLDGTVAQQKFLFLFSDYFKLLSHVSRSSFKKKGHF